MGCDELAHQADAGLVLKDLDRHSAGAEQLFLAEEGLILADDDARDAVQKDRPRAHRTWRERRVEHRLAVDRRRLAAGVLQGIHLAVQHRASSLHPPVVTAADDASSMNDRRTDRNAAFLQSLLRLFDRGLHEWVSHRIFTG